MHTFEFLKHQLAFIQSKNSLIFLSGLIVVSLSSSTNLMAQGNLMIFPRRVVFEGSKRSQTLNLANTGMETARYNISFVQYRMKENGAFEEIEKGIYIFAPDGVDVANELKQDIHRNDFYSFEFF